MSPEEIKELEAIRKIISIIDPDWKKSSLINFTFKKENEFIVFIYNVIKGHVKVPERSIYKSSCLTKDLLITKESVRDILLAIGIGGEIAAFATCVADEINKNAPLHKLMLIK